MEKYIFVNWRKHNSFEHIKIRDFIKIINANKKVEFLNLTTEDTKKFIAANVNKSYLLVFPFYIYNKLGGNPYIPFYNEMAELASYTDNLVQKLGHKIKCKFVFNSMELVFGTINERYLRILFGSRNIYLILNVENLDDVKIHCTREYSCLKNENVYFSGYHYCYFSAPFNQNPINKISMAGDKRNNVYTKRYLFDKALAVHPTKYEYLTYNKNELMSSQDFVTRLNKYVCSFYSSHNIYHNSGALHKIFEILGSGALLLTSYKDTKIFDLLGLKRNIHYMILDDNVDLHVNFILDMKNRTYIDNIRKTGQEFCRKNLDANFLYKKYIKILDTISSI